MGYKGLYGVLSTGLPLDAGHKRIFNNRLFDFGNIDIGELEYYRNMNITQHLLNSGEFVGELARFYSSVLGTINLGIVSELYDTKLNSKIFRRIAHALEVIRRMYPQVKQDIIKRRILEIANQWEGKISNKQLDLIVNIHKLFN